MIKKTIFVGLSGGVDSAVSAALLKKAGHEVVGVFIRTWHPEFLECNEEEERSDAMRVAAHLNIPFLTFNLEKIYKKEVADYMIREYKAGHTPNPDVMCNKEVKFGAFMKKALSMGADAVATGHYANLTPSPSPGQERVALSLSKGRVRLLKGIDSTKDQSYFLWTLRQDQLSKIIFPIGHLQKTEVRKLARKFKLPVAEKKDSQGICFLGRVDLKNFLKHYIKEKKGKVVLASSEGRSDLKNSKRSDLGEPEVIGHHNGVAFSTLGERHGFTITKRGPNDSRYYIIAKDIKKNILVVSTNKNILQKGTHNFLLKICSCSARRPAQVLSKEHFCLPLENTNWINKIPDSNKKYTAQIRYHGELLPCQIKITGKKSAEIIFNQSTLVASGQSVVVYEKNICLGGGVVI